MTKKEKIALFGFIFFIIAFISLYYSGLPRHSAKPISGDIPGFFEGCVHGFLIWFDFVMSFFKDTRIYSYPNSGKWYDFGFILGIITFFLWKLLEHSNSDEEDDKNVKEEDQK